jgi:hypothetical protein
MIRKAMTRGWDTSRMLILRGQDWARVHLPPGLRLVVGLLLICGGFLAILPVFGLWMLPLGMAIAALDVMAFLRWIGWAAPLRPPEEPQRLPGKDDEPPDPRDVGAP